MTKTPRELARDLRQARSYLRGLTSNVDQFLRWLDAEMVKPSTPERGSRVAKAANSLDMANQVAKRYGLGRVVRKRRTVNAASIAKDGRAPLREG